MSRLVMLPNALQVPGFLVLSEEPSRDVPRKPPGALRPAESVPTHAAAGRCHGQKARKQIIWQQFRGLMQQFSRLAWKQGSRIRPFGYPIRLGSEG